MVSLRCALASPNARVTSALVTARRRRNSGTNTSREPPRRPGLVASPVPQNQKQPAHAVFNGVGVVDAVAVPISLYFKIDVPPLVLHAGDDIQDVPECSGVEIRGFLADYFSFMISSLSLVLVLRRGRECQTSGKMYYLLFL